MKDTAARAMSVARADYGADALVTVIFAALGRARAGPQPRGCRVCAGICRAAERSDIRYAKEHSVYIGIGTIVVIVIVVLIILALRR